MVVIGCLVLRLQGKGTRHPGFSSQLWQGNESPGQNCVANVRTS